MTERTMCGQHVHTSTAVAGNLVSRHLNLTLFVVLL
jgi:hypothetical protein